MIEKIKNLSKKTASKEVISLCENAISTISSGIYNNIPDDAKFELEKAVIESLFEGLKTSDDKDTQIWLKNSLRSWTVQNIGVRQTINSLLESEAKTNDALRETLINFKEQIKQQPEVLIYESFISALQSFSYFPEVGNALKAIESKISNYKSDVDISKVLETMKQTSSSYLVPLIEDLVSNYLENKTRQTKSSLKEGLIKFSYDPFVRDLINLVTIDAKELQLEHANAQCDIEKIYSPILYLGENEAIFSIKNSYYIKKGNNISILNEDITDKLDNDFKRLCEAINSNNVIIKDDSITIYEGKDKSVISEEEILFNGELFTADKIKEALEISKWTGKDKILSLTSLFASNFNEIAEIDFAKRVYLKEQEELAADIFKLRDNVSIATFDPEMESGTFYRNINPIQAKTVMMEHLSYDVSNLFKGLLPNEKKILAEISETKQSYNDYIDQLKEKINEITNIDTSFSTDINKNVIEVLNEELTDVKNEFKDYLNSVEEFTKPLNEAQVTLEINGPLEIQVDGQKFTVPIPTGQNPTPQFQQGEVSSDPSQQGVLTTDDSAITFDPEAAEATGTNPSIDDDKIDLDSDKISADTDAEDAEKEANGEVGSEDIDNEEGLGSEETGDDNEDEEDFSLNLDDLDDKDKESEDDDTEDHDEGDIDVSKKKKKKKNESSSNASRTRKVYLKKKK